MDNLITGFIAVVVFIAFVLGLAVSIGTLPFILIVLFVSGLILVDFYQSARAGLQNKSGDTSE
jgi:hypothetical protein